MIQMMCVETEIAQVILWLSQHTEDLLLSWLLNSVKIVWMDDASTRPVENTALIWYLKWNTFRIFKLRTPTAPYLFLNDAFPDIWN